MRVLVLSATYGGHDARWPHEPQDTSHRVDWIHLTDGVSPPWIAAGPPWESFSPRLKARYWKCQPPVIDDVDVVIWVDGSIEITKRDFVDTMVELLGDDDVALFAHASRSTIAEEAKVCSSMAKYSGIDHAELLTYLEGVYDWPPARRGLAELGVMVRRNNGAMHDFGLHLWNETLAWSTPASTVMDQLLVPPLLLYRGVRWTIMPGSVWTGGAGNWFRLHDHLVDG